MNVNTALNAYSQHALSVDIKTSSGDKISFDFNNEKSLQYSKSDTQESFSFSSLESFSFSYKGDGIDAQDQKEIDAFLKIAQPFIDKFVSGLNEDSILKEPINKITSNIANIFEPIKEKNDDNLLNLTKNRLVGLFDNAFRDKIDPIEQTQSIISDAQRFLDQLFKNLDKADKELYL